MDRRAGSVGDSGRQRCSRHPRRRAAEEKLAEYDTKLSRYRAALEAGTDPEIVGEWIREVKADRALANAQLKERDDGSRWLVEDEIVAHLEATGDVATMIREAGREVKGALYTGLDLRLTYHPVKRVVRAEADLGSHETRNMYKLSCPRGEMFDSPMAPR